MTISTIQGEENINKALNAAKCAVVQAMINEKLISQEDGENFMNNYYTLMAYKEGIFSKIFSRSTSRFNVVCTKFIA